MELAYRLAAGESEFVREIRDNIGQSLALSRAVTRTYLEYRPTVFHDHHESASHLYASTGRGPYNAWLDPIVINEWNRLAYKEVKDMTAYGVPGVMSFTSL